MAETETYQLVWWDGQDERERIREIDIPVGQDPLNFARDFLSGFGELKKYGFWIISLEKCENKKDVAGLLDLLERYMTELRDTAEKNSFSSSFDHIFQSPDYRAIVELGRNERFKAETVRFLSRDLVLKRTWETVFALMAILEYQPKPGEIDEVVEGTGMMAFSLPNLAKALIAESEEYLNRVFMGG